MFINRPKVIFIFLLMAMLTVVGRTQTQILTNVQVIEMAKAGLGEEIILNKIKTSECKFDVSVDALIELKKAGVSDATIGFMMEKASEKAPADASATQPTQGYSNSQSFSESEQSSRPPVTPKEALENAKTIALVKASLNPSRQALEKELMKRPEWKKFNLSIERYKDKADLYVEIGLFHCHW